MNRVGPRGRGGGGSGERGKGSGLSPRPGLLSPREMPQKRLMLGDSMALPEWTATLGCEGVASARSPFPPPLNPRSLTPTPPRPEGCLVSQSSGCQAGSQSWTCLFGAVRSSSGASDSCLCRGEKKLHFLGSCEGKGDSGRVLAWGGHRLEGLTGGSCCHRPDTAPAATGTAPPPLHRSGRGRPQPL